MDFIIRRQLNYSISILNCYCIYIHELKIWNITLTIFLLRFFDGGGGGRETKSDESEDQSSIFCVDKYVTTHIIVVKT